MTNPWLTLCTKQQMELRVDALLTSQGIETYLPVVEKYVVRRKRIEASPFFPGYLFARVKPTSAAYLALNWVPGLKGIVRFGGHVAWVPNEIVTDIQQRLKEFESSGYFVRTCPYQPGDVVRIKTGPFRDLDAVFDRELSRQGRARVLLEVLGRLTGCEIELDWLEKVG